MDLLPELIQTAIVNKSLGGVMGFLRITCKPFAEEFGLLLADKVKYWRLMNKIRVVEKSLGKIDFDEETSNLRISPRLMQSILDSAELEDDDSLQDMWAGLIASSCNEVKEDDSNIIFIDVLKRITKRQALLIKYVCEKATKRQHSNGLVDADPIAINSNEIMTIFEVQDIFDLELDIVHLKGLNIFSEFDTGMDKKNIIYLFPTVFALNFYVRVSGSKLSIKKYWENNLLPFDENERNKNSIYGNAFGEFNNLINGLK